NEYRSPRELRAAIRGYIDDYNSLRPHEALDYATPDEVYRACFSTTGAA
ncbi:MAG: integrase core domain-containing protein, partial [Oscillospiraceae bacterium]|nr:integrase core domain-containing protein [Oscillospiraceae bacterium]